MATIPTQIHINFPPPPEVVAAGLIMEDAANPTAAAVAREATEDSVTDAASMSSNGVETCSGDWCVLLFLPIRFYSFGFRLIYNVGTHF
jgi:hypothetical protein